MRWIKIKGCSSIVVGRFNNDWGINKTPIAYLIENNNVMTNADIEEIRQERHVYDEQQNL